MLLQSTLLLPLVLVRASPPLSETQEGFKKDVYNNISSNEEFSDWLDSGNASVSHSVRLPDVQSSEYPGGDEDTTWEAWVRVAHGSNVDRYAEAYAGFFPTLQDDSADNATFDDSWLVCPSVSRFQNNIPLDEEVKEDCSNVFSEECLAWLEDEWAKDGRMCLNQTKYLGTEWADSPCGDDGFEPVVNPNNVLEPERVSPASDLSDFASEAYASTQQSGEERYDDLVDSIYFLSIGFARVNEDVDVGQDRVNQTAPTVNSRFFCMRPDTFPNGSRTLEDIEDAGVGMVPSVGLALLGAFVASFVAVSML